MYWTGYQDWHWLCKDGQETGCQTAEECNMESVDEEKQEIGEYRGRGWGQRTKDGKSNTLCKGYLNNTASEASNLVGRQSLMSRWSLLFVRSVGQRSSLFSYVREGGHKYLWCPWQGLKLTFSTYWPTGPVQSKFYWPDHTFTGPLIKCENKVYFNIFNSVVYVMQPNINVFN